MFGASLSGVFVVMLLGIYSAIYSGAVSIRTKATLRKILIGLTVILLLAPFTLTFIAGSGVPIRALIAVPYVVWFFTVMALENPAQIIRILATIAIGISIFQILYISSQLAATRQITQQRDYAMAASIYERIVNVNPNFNPEKTYQVDFFGGQKIDKPYPTGKGSTAGGSFFAWDGGCPKRIISFMRLIGYGNLEVLKKNDRLTLLPHYLTMPTWPAQGSVKRLGDITLIKLGETPGMYEDVY